MDLFEIEVVSRCRIGGETTKPGTRLALPAADAESLLACRRGRLVHDADAERLQRARAAALRRALGGSPPQWPGAGPRHP